MNLKLDTSTRAFIAGFLPPLVAEFVKMGSGVYNTSSTFELVGIFGAAIGTGVISGLAAAFALNTLPRNDQPPKDPPTT